MGKQISTAQAVAIVVASSTAVTAALWPLAGWLAILALPMAIFLMLPSLRLLDRPDEPAKVPQKVPSAGEAAG
jgi:hypothetical protein